MDGGLGIGGLQTTRRNRRTSTGQALAEMAFVVTLAVMLASGIVEFGRAFWIAGMITHAARDGARVASKLPASYRDDAGCLTTAGKTVVSDHVEGIVAALMDRNGQLDGIFVEQELGEGTPTVRVRIEGDIEYVTLVGLLGASFHVNRSITFRDELRPPENAC